MSFAGFGQNFIGDQMTGEQQKAQDGWDIEDEDFPSDHGNQDQQQQLNNFRDNPNQNQKNNDWEIDDDIDDLSQTPAESQLKQEQQTKFQQDEQKSPEQVDMWGKFTNTVQQTQTIEKLIKESAPQKIKQTFQNIFGSQNNGSNNINISQEQTSNSKVFASAQQVIDMKKLFELEKQALQQSRSELEDQMKLRRIQEQNELREQKEELENKIKQFQIEKEQFNQQLKEAKQLFKLTELIEPQDNHQDIICKLTKENENLNNDITKLIETQEKQINDYEDNIEQMQQEIEYYKNQFINYQSKYQNAKEKMRVEIPKILNQLMTLQKLELNTLVTNKLTQFQKYYKTKQQDLLQYALQTTSTQSKQIHSLKEDNIRLMQQVDELDELKDEHQSSLYIIKQLRISEDKLIEENERIQNQNQDKENMILELQNSINDLRNENEKEKFNLNQLILSLQSQIDQFKRNSVDKQSINKLENSLALFQEEKKALLSSLENKETQIIVLEQQIQELNEELTKQQNVESNDIWKQEDKGWELDDSFQRKYDELELQMIQFRNENHELKYQLKEMEVRMLQQQHKQEAQVEQMHQLQMCLVDTEYQKNFQNAVQQERIQELEEQISIEKRKFSDEEEKVSEQNLQADEDSQRAINQLRQIDYEGNAAQREDGAWEFEDSLNVDIQEQEIVNEGAGEYQNIQLGQGQNIQQDNYEKQVDESSDFQDEIQQIDDYVQDDSKQNDQSDNKIHQQNDVSQEQEDNQNEVEEIQQNIEKDSEELSEREGLLQNYDEEDEENYENIEENQDLEIDQDHQQNEESYDDEELPEQDSKKSLQDNQVEVQQMNVEQNNLDDENNQNQYQEEQEQEEEEEEEEEGSQKQEEIQNEEEDSEYQNVEYESQENNDDQNKQGPEDQISSNEQIESQNEDQEEEQQENDSNQELNQDQEQEQQQQQQEQQQEQEDYEELQVNQNQKDYVDNEINKQNNDTQNQNQEEQQQVQIGNDQDGQEINSDEQNQDDQQNISDKNPLGEELNSEEGDHELNDEENESLSEIDGVEDQQVNQQQVDDNRELSKEDQVENVYSDKDINVNQQHIQNNLQEEQLQQVIKNNDELAVEDSNTQENNQNNEEVEIQNQINKEQEQLELQYQLVVEPINNSNSENQAIEKSLGDLDALDSHIKKVVINSSNQLENNYNIEVNSQKNAQFSQDLSHSYQDIGVQEIISKPVLFSDPRSQDKSANDYEDEIQNVQEHYEVEVKLNEPQVKNLVADENENPDEEGGNQWNVDDDIDFENEIENPQVQVNEENQSNKQIIETNINNSSQKQKENREVNQEPLENLKVNQQIEEETPDVQFDDDQDNQEDNNNPPVKNVERVSQGQLDLEDELEEIDPWAEQQKQGENAESGWDLDDI